MAQCDESRNLMSELERAETAVIDDELGEARTLVQGIFGGLECLEGGVDPTLITGLWQVSAAIRFFDGAEELALLDLARGKSIPGAIFRERLGADLRKVWRELVVDFNAHLEVGPIPPGYWLAVDGANRRSNSILLPAGWHLIQVFKGEERVLHQAMHLNSGQRARVKTGLIEPDAQTNLSGHRRRAFLWTGVASGVAALGSYGLAVSYDSRLKSAKDVDELYELRGTSQDYAAGAVGLAILSACSLGLHFSF